MGSMVELSAVEVAHHRGTLGTQCCPVVCRERDMSHYREAIERVIRRKLVDGDYLLALERASTDEVTQKSPAEQHDINEAFAANEIGLPIREHYVDWMSRSLWPRPEIERMLVDIQERHCVGVIMWRSDRLIGEELHSVMVTAALEDGGVAFIDCDDRRVDDPTDRYQALIRLIGGWHAGTEVRKLRRAVHDTHAARFLRGQFIQRPPTGLRFDAQSGNVVVWPEQLDAVRRMFDLVGNHGYTVYRAARALEAEGAAVAVHYRCGRTNACAKRHGYWAWPERPPLCKKCGEIATIVEPVGWSVITVRRILQNRLYLGTMVWNRYKTVHKGNRKTRVVRPDSDWIAAPSPFGNLLAHDDPAECNDPDCTRCSEAVATFERANALIAVRRRAKSTKRIHEGRPLDLVVRCGRCGKKLYAKRSRKVLKNGERSNRWEYQCATRKNTAAACQRSHVISESTLWRMVRQFLTELAADAELDERLTVTWVRPHLPDGQRPALEATVREATENLRELIRERTRARTAGETDPDAQVEVELIQEDIYQVKRRLATARSTLDALDAQQVARPNQRATAEARAFLASVVDTWLDESIPVDVRQAHVAKFLVAVYVDHPHVRVEIRERRAGDRGSTPPRPRGY